MGPAPHSPGSAGYWDRVAREKRFTLPLYTHWFASRMEPEAHILDFGCGPGRTLLELRRAGYNHLTGMDISSGMLRECRSRFPAAPLVHCDGWTIPLRGDSVDAVVLLAVLTCLPSDAHQLALVSEIRRVLRPGGLLYISDFLLNGDARNRERYERSAPEGSVYGVFKHPEGVLLRHHRPEWIAELTRAFQQLEYELFEAVTMNGNRSSAFQYLGRSGDI